MGLVSFFCWSFTGLLFLTILCFFKALIGPPLVLVPGGWNSGDASFVDAAMFLSDKD